MVACQSHDWWGHSQILPAHMAWRTMWTSPCLYRQRAGRVAIFMLKYPRDLCRRSESFCGATGFPPVQLVDQVHLVRASLRAARLQAVKDGVHQSARDVTGVLCCYKPVRWVVRHTVAIPRSLLDQSLCAGLGHVDRRHDATLPGVEPGLRMSYGPVRVRAARSDAQRCMVARQRTWLRRSGQIGTVQLPKA